MVTTQKPGVTRRGLAKMALGASAVGALAYSGLEQPAMAVDSKGHRPKWGVNLKAPTASGPYSDIDEVFAAVRASRAHWVRDNMTLDSTYWPQQKALWQRLRDVGIGVQTIAGHSTDPTSARTQITSQLRQAAHTLIRVEGWSEADDRNQMSSIASHQRYLWNTVKGNASLADVTVVAPSIKVGPSMSDASATRRFHNLYTAIAGHYDHANLYVYPGGGHPSADYFLDKRISQLPAAARAAVVVSEGGYVTRNWEAATVYTEAEQASRLVDYVQQAQSRSLQFAMYELFDHIGSFGLFHSNYKPKPVVKALAAL